MHRYNTRSRSGHQEESKIRPDEGEMGERRDGSPPRDLNNQMDQGLTAFAQQQQQMMQQFQDRMITAMGQLRMGHSRSRRSSSVPSRTNSRHENQDRVGSNAVRTTNTRSDRPLHPTFLPRQNEEETIPEQPEVETHITNDVLATYVDYMALLE